MPLPVISNVFRVAINWVTDIGEPNPVNVFHVRTALNSYVDIAEALGEEVETNMFGGMPTTYSATTCDIIELDGVSAGATVPLDNWAGETADGDCLPQLSAVISLRTGHRGPSGRGRIFRPGLMELIVTDGRITSTSQGEIQEAWDTWRTNLAGRVVPIDLVVASYVTPAAYDVTQISVNRTPGIIRRRMPRS